MILSETNYFLYAENTKPNFTRDLVMVTNFSALVSHPLQAIGIPIKRGKKQLVQKKVKKLVIINEYAPFRAV